MNALLGSWTYVHLSFCLDFVLSSSMRQTAVSWGPAGSTFTNGLGTTYRSVSKVQCVMIGLEDPSAIGLFYSKRDRNCLLKADLPKQLPSETKSNVSFAVLRHIDEDNERFEKARTGFVPFEEIGLSLMYHSVDKPYREGDHICDADSSTFFQIDNQKKQDIAAKLQERSDQRFVFAGVYKKYLMTWLYEDDTPVNYTNWAYKEPKLPTFAALSKADDYKWLTVGEVEEAGWICQKPID